MLVLPRLATNQVDVGWISRADAPDDRRTGTAKALMALYRAGISEAGVEDLSREGKAPFPPRAACSTANPVKPPLQEVK